MNKSTVFIILGVVIVGISLLVYSFINFEPTTPFKSSSDVSGSSSSSASSNSTVNSSTGSNATTQQPKPTSSKISMKQLASHNSKEDCWVGYQGKAYDLTSWIPRHPGGQTAIAQYCGTSTEFQEAFQRQHGSSKASMFMKVSVYKGDLE